MTRTVLSGAKRHSSRKRRTLPPWACPASCRTPLPQRPRPSPARPREARRRRQNQALGESSATRTYELGREVAVSNIAPGTVKRLSVAVALNQNALKGAKPADLKKFEQLVTAAVGADSNRGDTVAVVVRPFQATEIEAASFWETSWFATILRNAVALISVLLVLLLAVRPVIKSLSGRKAADEDSDDRPEPAAMNVRALSPSFDFDRQHARPRASVRPGRIGPADRSGAAGRRAAGAAPNARRRARSTGRRAVTALADTAPPPTAPTAPLSWSCCLARKTPPGFFPAFPPTSCVRSGPRCAPSATSARAPYQRRSPALPNPRARAESLRTGG